MASPDPEKSAPRHPWKPGKLDFRDLKTTLCDQFLKKCPAMVKTEAFFFWRPGSVELKKIDVILPRPLVFRPCERKNVFFGVPKKCTFSGPGNAPDRRSGNFGSRNFRVREISRDADFPGFPAPWPDPEKSSIFRSSRPQKMPRNGVPRPSEMASPDTLSGPQKTASGTQKSCPRPKNPARPQKTAQNPTKVPKTRKSARKRVFEPISSPDAIF